MQEHLVICFRLQISFTRETFEVTELVRNITRGQRLTIGPQIYAMTKNFLTGEALHVFDHQAKYNGSKTMDNYKLAIEVITIHLFPPKVLQHQKRYLRLDL